MLHDSLLVDLTLDAELEVVDAEPVATVLMTVPLAKKLLLMQEAWQLAYFSVSCAVPLPCGHSAAQVVVALAWRSEGHGTKTQAA